MCVPLSQTLGGQAKTWLEKKVGIKDPGMSLTRSIDRSIYGKYRIDGAKQQYVNPNVTSQVALFRKSRNG